MTTIKSEIVGRKNMPPRYSGYQELIRTITAQLGYIGKYDPRHIEGYMRLEHSTLDGLSPAQFRAEVMIGIQCIDADGVENAENNAQSFGL